MSAIVIAGVVGLATVQDGGRPGLMDEGIPPGGALVPELLARANAAAENAWDEPALEVLGTLTLAARGSVRIGTDDGETQELAEGNAWTLVGAGARVRYLAVRGAFDVPRVLGGRGTLLTAAFGGHEGRALRRGDVLRTGGAKHQSGALPEAPDLRAPIRIVPGPDLDRLPSGALEWLLASTFTVDARSDRVGVRLSGPTLARNLGDLEASGPMLRGAIQLPPDGVPIALGPDHPTMGGYPVVATVVRNHLGCLAARPVGAAVRFVTES